MVDFPHPWDAYARLQRQLSDKTSVDDRSWGLEAGLGQILVPDDPVAIPLTSDAIIRTITNAARRDRYIRQLRGSDVDVGEADLVAEPIDRMAVLQMREELRIIKNVASQKDFTLLCAIGAGHEYSVLATRVQSTTGALRARVTRARQLCRNAIAA